MRQRHFSLYRYEPEIPFIFQISNEFRKRRLRYLNRLSRKQNHKKRPRMTTILWRRKRLKELRPKKKSQR